MMDEETGEITEVAAPEKKPSRFKMPERKEPKKKSGKLPRATVTTN